MQPSALPAPDATLRPLLRLAPLAAAGVACLVCLASLTPADVVKLKDGSRIEGDIRRSDEGWIVTDDKGVKTTISFGKVASIEATGKTGAGVVERGLASLRRASDNASDLRQIIDRYNAFIAQHEGDPIVEEARADLAGWEERLKQGRVKVGDQWLTEQEKAALEAKADATAVELAELFRGGQLRKAEPLLNRALDESPRSAALWYLKGVLLYRTDQLQPARKAFESALTLLPDHAPSLNNLAVILWRTNAPAAALYAYDKALLASPGDRFILDNLAEALHALPEDDRKREVTKRVVRHFNEQDLALQARLKDAGLFRWGATWVNASDLERLRKVQKEIAAKVAQMSAEYDAFTARIAALDERLSSADRLVRRMERDSYGFTPDGRQVRYPLPPSYYDTVNDIARMRGDRAAFASQQQALRRAATQLQQQLPIAEYTGLQRIMDVEGSPVAPTAAPANQPANPAPPAKPNEPLPPVKPSILERQPEPPPFPPGVGQ